MTIKHLIIPGGGPTGIKAIGALSYLEDHGYWSKEDLESIYCTSAGAILAVLISLKLDWQTIKDYVVKRPWHEAISITVPQVFDAFGKKGLFGRELTELFFKPCFLAAGLPLNATLKDLHDFSNIEMHVFTLEVNSFDIHDISYKTHPDIEILTAVQMTASVPMLIAPVCIGDQCFSDGGVLCNYPVYFCLQNGNSPDEIFGIRNDYASDAGVPVNAESTAMDYLLTFMTKLLHFAGSARHAPMELPNELVYSANMMTMTIIQKAWSSQEMRQQLLKNGEDAAEDYLKRRL